MDAMKMNNVWDSIAKTLKIEGLDGDLHLELDYKLCLHILRYDDIMICNMTGAMSKKKAMISRVGKWHTRYIYRIPNTAFRFRNPHIACLVNKALVVLHIRVPIYGHTMKSPPISNCTEYWATQET